MRLWIYISALIRRESEGIPSVESSKSIVFGGRIEVLYIKIETDLTHKQMSAVYLRIERIHDRDISVFGSINPVRLCSPSPTTHNLTHNSIFT